MGPLLKYSHFQALTARKFANPHRRTTSVLGYDALWLWHMEQKSEVTWKEIPAQIHGTAHRMNNWIHPALFPGLMNLQTISWGYPMDNGHVKVEK